MVALAARQVRRLGQFDLVVGTSKTFRSLARLAGAAPSSAGLRARRTLTDVELRQVFGFISRIPSADLAELEGVSAGRAHQLVAGAWWPRRRCARCGSASCRSAPGHYAKA